MQPSYRPYAFAPPVEQLVPQVEERINANWGYSPYTAIRKERLVNVGFNRAFKEYDELERQTESATQENVVVDQTRMDESELFRVRHRFQTVFLHSREAPQEKDMAQMDEYLARLEEWVEHTPAEEIQKTKIDKVLRAMATNENLPLEEQFHFQQRARDLTARYTDILQQDQQNHQAGSSVRHLSTDQIMHEPDFRPTLAQQEQAQEQENTQVPPQQADEDLARTAGELLANLADNKTTKFRESGFLTLMRKLRDREVHVRGDEMVDVDAVVSFNFTSASS